MKAVLAAFQSPMADGTSPRAVPLPEFSEFWKSLTDDEKTFYKSNAAEMGFTA